MLDTLLIGALVILVYWVLLKPHHPKDFPPGPRFSLPIIGDLFAVGSNTLDAFQRMRKQYGDVFGLSIGPQRIVVLNNYDLIQEAGAREELIGRVTIKDAAHQRGSVDPSDKDKFPGVLTSQGQTWLEQRRFSLHTLRDLGFGKNSTEEMAREEVAELNLWLESTSGQPVDIRNKFNIAILNALWRITTSERLHYDDPKLNKLLLLLDRFLQEGGRPINNMIANSPVLLWMANKVGLLAVGTIFTELRDFVQESLDPIKATYQEDSLRNFVDHYYKAMNENAESGQLQTFVGEEGATNLVNVLIDLFIAGSETTSTTLSWGMLYMILNPDIQKKVQQELDDVVGKGITPVAADRVRTPYTEAVIHEVQRLGNILNVSVPHGTTSDVRLSTGHMIPRDTVVMCHIGEVMRDPEHFPEPNKFDPTRHLTKEGNFKAHPRVVPFGVGRRRCLGETLARMELYLFFTGILSRFDLEKASPHDVLPTRPLIGLVMSPQPYKMKFIPRS